MHPRIARILATALGLAALAGPGCATTPRTPADHARDRLETAIDQHRDQRSFRVRLNPVPCDCPPFEVLLGDAWRRAFLEPPGDDGPVGALQTRLLEAETRGEALQALVAGSLSGGVRLAPNRLPCVVLKVSNVCPDAGCPVEGE
jgi:hypothetical protein